MDDMGKRRGSEPPKPGTASAIREASKRSSAEQPPRPARPTKRVYSAEFKQRILREIEALGASGERGAQGAFLRREGVTWANVHRWERERAQGELAALQPKKRGRKPVSEANTEPSAAEELARLRRQNERLQDELRKAEIIIDVQKKLSALLGVSMPTTAEDDETS